MYKKTDAVRQKPLTCLSVTVENWIMIVKHNRTRRWNTMLSKNLFRSFPCSQCKRRIGTLSRSRFINGDYSGIDTLYLPWAGYLKLRTQPGVVVQTLLRILSEKRISALATNPFCSPRWTARLHLAAIFLFISLVINQFKESIGRASFFPVLAGKVFFNQQM